MGTVAAPNLVIALIDLATGALDTGETVEVVLHGNAYPGDAIAVPEIGSTGYYKIEEAGGVAALAQGIYEVYVGGTFKSVITHGYTGLQDHIISVSDPHGVAAAQVAIVDAGGYISGTEVEAAIQELGAALAAKADASGTVLTDNSNQSVDGAKPKVTNLDADQVDGAHAGNSAGNVLLLDANGLILLANIPDTLTGKDADTVDGKHVGNSVGNLPELSATGAAGKLDTSLLAKQVGTDNNEIPQVSTSAAAGKLDDSLLGVAMGQVGGPPIIEDGNIEAMGLIGKIHEWALAVVSHRTSGKNFAESPNPDITGGGSIWAEDEVPDDTAQVTLDGALDWRDRMITIVGYINKAQSGAQLPGAGSDDDLEFGNSENTDFQMISGGFYSQSGREGAGNAPGFRYRIGGSDDYLYFWVDASDGFLKCGKAATANGTLHDFFVRIDYSPHQNEI